jgi:hypothetical protein
MFGGAAATELGLFIVAQIDEYCFNFFFMYTYVLYTIYTYFLTKILGLVGYLIEYP